MLFFLKYLCVFGTIYFGFLTIEKVYNKIKNREEGGLGLYSLFLSLFITGLLVFNNI